MKRNLVCLASALIAVLLMISMAGAQADNAGNVFISDSSTSEQIVPKDLYWAGGSRNFSGYQVGKSFIAAGRDITITESEIGGSLRAAGYSITLNGVDVADNITAAGYDLQMSGMTASGVYLVGNTLHFSGTADCISMAGNSVTLDGEIHGNADIYADKIVFGKNLVVDGILKVQSDDEPVLPSEAKIGEFLFKQTETIDDPEDIAEKVKESRSSSDFGGFIRRLFGTCLLAALICLLLGDEELRKPGEMLLQRPLPMLGTGFAGLFVIPGLILILLFIGIGFPSAGLLTLLFAIACIYALTYTGMTIAKTLIPRFTDNKILNNVWISSLIGALVFHLLKKIPVIGVILLAASMIYTLGYFVQVVFLRLRKSAQKRAKGTLKEAAENDVLQKVGMDEIADPIEDTSANSETADMSDGTSNEETTDAVPETEENCQVLPDAEDEVTTEQQPENTSFDETGPETDSETYSE